jgi:polyisoprenoid-binding protein YceI
MNKLLAAAALAVASAPAFAADTYVIDPTHTYPMFEVSHLGFSTTRGGFNKTGGTIVLDMAKKTGSVDIVIDATSLATPVPKLDDHLKNEDFFNVAKYPAITFKSNQLAFEGDALKSVTGDLTMHGVTRPVTLEVTHFVCKEHPMTKKPHCGADAHTTIKRSEWGITTYSPAVGEDVKLKIQVEATKQ